MRDLFSTLFGIHSCMLLTLTLLYIFTFKETKKTEHIIIFIISSFLFLFIQAISHNIYFCIITSIVINSLLIFCILDNLGLFDYFNNLKILKTTYSIKKINSMLLLDNSNDIYLVISEYKGHKKVINKYINIDNANYRLQELNLYKDKLLKKKYEKLKSKNFKLFKKYNNNTINLLSNIN